MIPFELTARSNATTVRLNGEEVPRLVDVVFRHALGDTPALELHTLAVAGGVLAGEADEERP